MGQKVNPQGFRLALTRKWESRWFAPKNSFRTYLKQDHDIRSCLRKKYPEGAIKDILIFRSAKNIDITIHTAKPGIIIGRAGQGMNEIKGLVEMTCFDNSKQQNRPRIHIHIEDIREVEKSAYLIAESVAYQIEKRIAVRKAIKKALEKLQDKGIKGAKIRVSGRLGGAEIARSESQFYGSLPLHTLRTNIDYAMIRAITTYGTIGVKVWLNLGKFSREFEDEKDIIETERRKNR